MNGTILATLALVTAMGSAVVLTRDPHRQLFVVSGSSIALTLFFFAVQAPDVAISEIGVGAVIVPLLFLVALTAIANADDAPRKGDADDGASKGGVAKDSGSSGSDAS